MTALPINLPEGFSTVVKVGDNVTIGQTIANKTSYDEEIINIPQELSIKKSQVKKYLKKSPGEGVTIGDIIAQKNSFLGSNVIIKSNTQGTVARYERDTGNLVIKKSQKTTSNNLISPVDGIVALCDNSKIVINTDKNVVVGIAASGESGQGEVHVLKEDDPYHLDSSAVDKIVVGANFTREMLLKGIGIGVLGIVGSEISQEDIDYINSKKIKTPVLKIEKKRYGKSHSMEYKKAFC